MRHHTIAAAICGALSLLSLGGCTNAYAISDTKSENSFLYQSGSKAKTIDPSSKMKTVVRKAGKFSAINVMTGIRVVYSPNEMETKVVVTAPDNVVEYLLTEVKDGCLTVHYGNVNIKSPKGDYMPTVYVTGRDVRGFAAKSSGSIIMTHDVVATEKVEISASEAGQIVAEKPIIAPEMEIVAQSGGVVKLSGTTVSSLAVAASSASTIIMGKTIVSGPFATNANSAASIDITDLTATALDAGASSSGCIRLAGHCPNTTYEVSSAGTIMAGTLLTTDCTAEASSTGKVIVNALNLTRKTSSNGVIINEH